MARRPLTSSIRRRRLRREAGMAPGAPVNLTKPVISGSPVVGATLTASTGTWTGSPTSYSYQWKENGVNIPDATNSSFVLTVNQAGDAITVTVTANNGQTASVTSDPVGPVTNPSTGTLAFDPSKPVTGYTLSNSNKTVTNTSGTSINASQLAMANQPMTGKTVWAVRCDAVGPATMYAGLIEAAKTGLGGNLANAGQGIGWGHNANSVSGDGVTQNVAPGLWTSGDTLMFAWDPATGKLWLGKNGTWVGSGDPGAGTNQTATVSSPTTTKVPAVQPRNNNSAFTLQAWPYAVPTGFSKYGE